MGIYQLIAREESGVRLWGRAELPAVAVCGHTVLGPRRSCTSSVDGRLLNRVLRLFALVRTALSHHAENRAFRRARYGQELSWPEFAMDGVVFGGISSVEVDGSTFQCRRDFGNFPGKFPKESSTRK